MATITVKNLPDDLYAEVKQAAKTNHRSINSEIIVCIERALRSQRISAEAAVSRPPRMWELAGGHVITDDELNEAKRAGRP